MINAHHFFTKALSQSDEIQEETHGNIFIYPCDEELDKNPPKPYIVVANRGTQNDSTCKDDSEYDGTVDNTTIEIVVCGDEEEQIVRVAQLVRDCIATAMRSFDADQFETLGWWLQDSSYSDSGIAFNDYTLNRSTNITYRIETSK